MANECVVYCLIVIVCISHVHTLWLSFLSHFYSLSLLNIYNSKHGSQDELTRSNAHGSIYKVCTTQNFTVLKSLTSDVNETKSTEIGAIFNSICMKIDGNFFSIPVKSNDMCLNLRFHWTFFSLFFFYRNRWRCFWEFISLTCVKYHRETLGSKRLMVMMTFSKIEAWEEKLELVFNFMGVNMCSKRWFKNEKKTNK